MPILHPSVLAPLSPCSAHIRLSGSFPGASIEVFADDRLVASGRTAEFVDQTFELDPGQELHANEVVWAAQTVGGERSSDELARDHGVTVMAAPPSGAMGGLTWRSHLHVCSHCVRLTGAIPGAVVTVRDGLGNDLGGATAVGTLVKPVLSRPIGGGETLAAEYLACGVAGPPTPSPTHSPTPDDPIEIPTPLPDPLRRPRIQSPLLACGRRVQLADVYEGARVTVSRAGAGDRQFCSTISNPYRDYSEADQLTEGETVTARHGFPGCQPLPEETETTRVVGPADDLPEPEVEGPLCAGSTYLWVNRLVPYATVRIYVDGDELGQIAAAETTQTIPVPSLPSGTLHVTQELCGVVRRSQDVEVRSCEPPGAPDLTQPYECATVVHVSNVRRSARVRIGSNVLGWIGEAVAQGPEVLISVPTLTPRFGHSLRPVAQVAGSEVVGAWKPVRSLMLGLGELTPWIRTVLTSDRSVVVENVVPGAVVEVYVDGELRGSAQAGGLIGHHDPPGSGNRLLLAVPISGTLSDNSSIRARQRFCQRESGISEPLFPVHCRRRIQVGLKSLDESWLPSLRGQVDWMRSLFRLFGFEVRVVHEEILDAPELRNLNTEDRDQVDELLGRREGLAEHDIAVYMVNSLEDPGPEDPMGVHYRDTGGAIVEEGSTYYTVAHEAGHVLGLLDDDNAPMRRLMYPGNRLDGDPTPSISDSALTASETDTMAAGSYTYPC